MPVDLNASVPHSARIYDYLLGGKDNFEADRAAAAEIVKSAPSLPISMRTNRQYMVRVAHYLAADRGIRQFLDIGTGLPTSPNLHEVVQRVEPASKIVYVDNDPIVLVHARALLTSTPEGATAYLDADLRDVEAILGSPQVKQSLDMTRPVSVSLIAVLQFIPDDDEVHRIIDGLMAPFPPGSTLAISAVTAENPRAVAGSAAYRARGISSKARTQEQITAMFRGLDLVEPGVVLVNQWRPDPSLPAVLDADVHMAGGVAVKR
jgi:hypothetical protein